MKKVLHHLISDKGLFLCLILTGAIFRFYKIWEMPFVHDELSALNRINFSSIHDVIKHGVAEQDNHPALIQVFLYYWTALVGKGELVVKFPFLLMGISSLWLLYKIGKNWFNTTTALFSIAFLASLQFPIMYSQIGRPYASGLFFSLLFVFFWNQFLFKNKTSLPTLIGLITAATLCNYNHYFSLLFAGMVGITGLFYLDKSNNKKYLIAMGVILILFIPGVSVLTTQLGHKGLDWLGTPSPLFILDHLNFVFHFNYGLIVLVGLLFLGGIFAAKKIYRNKFQLISMIWFLVPITIGTGYSIWVKPIIQHSMLLFSFPFLLLFLFSFYPNLSQKIKAIGIGFVVLVCGVSLVKDRQHYRVYYAQPFQEMFDFTKEHFQTDQTVVFINENPDYLSMYFDSTNIPVKSTFKKIPSPIEFRNQLAQTQSSRIILGNLPQNLVEIAKESFSHISSLTQGLNHYIIALDKLSSSTNLVPETLFYSIYTPDYPLSGWNDTKFPTIGKDPNSFQLTPQKEYGPVFENSLEGIDMDRFTKAIVKVDFRTHHFENGLMVLSLNYQGKEVMWQGISIDEYVDKSSFHQWNSAYLTTAFTSVLNPSHALEDYTIKVLIWNKDHQYVEFKNFEVTLTPGNKYEFATIEPIK